MNGTVQFLLLLAVTGMRATATHQPLAGEQILIVTSSGVPAYEEVLESMRKGMSQQAVYVLDVRQNDAEHILGEALRLKSVKVLVTIGGESAVAVLAQRSAIPLIATMVVPNQLTKDAGGRGRLASIVPVQVPLSTLLESVKRVFPAKSRLGMIRNAALPDIGPDVLRSTAEAAGFTVKIVDCSGPGELLQVFQSLKDQVDLVLCFPDATLYNSATAKPLVLASLRYMLPLIGFSESFVRAGAVLGVYPDFREMGIRGAELIQKVLNGQTLAKMEHPRKFRIAVNQNITRLLGLSYSQVFGAGEEFVVIR
jgi:putative tryptophan/tyrosine transport system substrate-binding protein